MPEGPIGKKHSIVVRRIVSRARRAGPPVPRSLSAGLAECGSRAAAAMLSACGALVALVVGAVDASPQPAIRAGASATPRFGFEVHLGSPLNVSTPFSLRQRGHPDLDFTGSYRSEPWTIPVYWSMRASYWRGDRGWALDLMHHKIILQDAPAEIQDFTVSHGFNILGVHRLWRWSSLELSAAVGAVIAHAENTVRSQRLDESGGIGGSGYYLTGPLVGGGAARRFRVVGPLHVVLNGRVTVARVKVPVFDGDASFTSLVFHGLVGIGFTR